MAVLSVRDRTGLHRPVRASSPIDELRQAYGPPDTKIHKLVLRRGNMQLAVHRETQPEKRSGPSAALCSCCCSSSLSASFSRPVGSSAVMRPAALLLDFEIAQTYQGICCGIDPKGSGKIWNSALRAKYHGGTACAVGYLW